MPMTPFMGVLISWLMFARNSLLARLASSAASRASRIVSSARRRSVMSRMISNPPATDPSSPSNGEAVEAT